MPCPLECTEPCQRCYEKTRADGVKEYACYGQCVVVDQMGISHNGHGEAAPAGWTPSAGGSMVEINGPISGSQQDCCHFGECDPTTVCWENLSDGICKCFPSKSVLPGWKKIPIKGVDINISVNRLVQNTVEEQRAALTVARRAANFDNISAASEPTCYACWLNGKVCSDLGIPSRPRLCYHKYTRVSSTIRYHICDCFYKVPEETEPWVIKPYLPEGIIEWPAEIPNSIPWPPKKNSDGIDDYSWLLNKPIIMEN